MEILELVVPGVGTVARVLADVYTLCNELKEGQDACSQVHERLQGIFVELQKMDECGQLPSNDTLHKYVCTVGRFLDYLKDYREQKLFTRLMQHFKMVEKLQSFNEEIDMLFKMLNLAATQAMMDWRQKSESLAEKQVQMMKEMVTNTALVYTELRDVRSQQEALATMQYMLAYKEGKGSDLARSDDMMFSLMKTYMTTIVKASRAEIKSLPPWFLPRDEVEFSREPFDIGSFGSVHRGVWKLGTKVVVKLLIMDESAMTACLNGIRTNDV